MEKMVFEMISFLQDWGLWRDVNIFAGGKRYSYEQDSSYGGLINVACEEDVDPEDYMEGPIEAGDKIIWSGFANPEHIFDMTYKGPLQMLLSYDEYEPDRKTISEKCRKYIEENTDLISDYILYNYEVEGPEDLAYQMWDELFDDPEVCCWDPLEFDTWEEYLDLLYGDLKGENPAYMQFDTYEEYCEFRDGGPEYFRIRYETEIHRRWEQMREEARRAFDQEGGALPKNIWNHVYNGFIRIFEKYGLWYEYCFNWSLTCFRAEA